MNDPPIEYGSRPPRRSLGKWVALLMVWVVGLCIWAMYIGVLFVVFLKVFG